MKVTVVPAQVTTVEDRIVGSLGFSQLVLIVTPVFIAAALFAVLPPAMGSAVYKTSSWVSWHSYAVCSPFVLKGKY